jgi:peptidoglycan/xylan/chitin deacetylase (PgdA/CDA1 family)
MARLSPLHLLVLATLAAGLASAQSPVQRTVALTIDDVPMTVVGNDHIAGPLAETREINESILRQLRQHHATAIGFVNEIKLNVQGERDARAALIEEWLDQGLMLGNHNYSHLAFSDAGLAAYEEDFLRGDTITNLLLDKRGITARYFRHPYLDTGKTAEDQKAFGALLAAHHYKIAPVTVQDEDWMFNAPYDEAHRHGDKQKMAKVVDAYLAHTAEMFEDAERESRDTFGHEIPLVLLMHADRINADHLDAVLRLMEQRGYRFITLDEALKDKAYETPDLYVGSDGGSWLDRWQIALGHPVRSAEPQPPDWVQKDYERITGTKP